MARGWTDSVLRGSAARVEAVLLPGIIPFLPLIFLGKPSPLTWLAAVLWFVAWAIFVSWRFIRYLKEISIKSDRQFDRMAKYDLPPEYADSESATKAKQRRMR